ncbi:MAG: patatin-like phospholipase family protein [Desulfobacterales bacterium]
MGAMPRFGLALSGGGARGLAHIGVLSVLQEEGRIPDLIVGSSIGAVIGAAYALCPDAEALKKAAARLFAPGGAASGALRRLKANRPAAGIRQGVLERIGDFAAKEYLLNLALLRGSLLSEREVRECLSRLVPDLTFADLRIPFAATAVDLVRGRRVILREGSLHRAVMASSALPGLMPPVAHQGMLLADGALLEALPAGVARELGAETVVGVDAGSRLEAARLLRDGIDVLQRATEIMMFHLRSAGRRACDVVVEPALEDFHWTDFASVHELVAAGERAARERLPALRSALGRGRWAGTIERLKRRISRR